MAMQLCYNRGCGKQYNIRQNSGEGEEACRHHPGDPYFHDAYKGWSCCQNKSTDFTTFLNTPGCSLGKHSNVKPINPEKITGNLTKEEPTVVETRPPIQPAAVRPPANSPLSRLEPTVAASLKQTVAAIPKPTVEGETKEISDGEACKNNGCKASFNAVTADSDCTHHPGHPVFHEGMKYWSCCQRKTSEFQQFLEQEGCDIGKHKWVADKTGTEVQCRYDWHQTATHVTVAVYAKKYDPERSYVELSPVRLVIHLVFPADNNNTFSLDLELKGVVEVEESKASMLGTKLEVKLKKAEAGSWAKLDIPKVVEKKIEKEETPSIVDMANKEPVVDSLDLEDLDITPQKFQLSDAAKTKPNY